MCFFFPVWFQRIFFFLSIQMIRGEAASTRREEPYQTVSTVYFILGILRTDLWSQGKFMAILWVLYGTGFFSLEFFPRIQAVQKNSQSCIIRFNRVWKGIFWIRENAKYFNWKRDLTATRKRHSQIFRHRMPDFFTSVCWYSQSSTDTRDGVRTVKITKK